MPFCGGKPNFEQPTISSTIFSNWFFSLPCHSHLLTLAARDLLRGTNIHSSSGRHRFILWIYGYPLSVCWLVRCTNSSTELDRWNGSWGAQCKIIVPVYKMYTILYLKTWSLCLFFFFFDLFIRLQSWSFIEVTIHPHAHALACFMCMLLILLDSQNLLNYIFNYNNIMIN